MDCDIYCISSKDRLPKKLYKNVNQINLYCGAFSLSQKERQELEKDFIFDDYKDEISALNFTFCELTGVYNVWKNFINGTKNGFIGFCHYRRFWKESELIDLDESSIYIPKRDIWDTSVYTQYIRHHGTYGMSCLDFLSNNNRIPIKENHFKQLFTLNRFHPCNMFIMNKSNFNKFSQIFFETLFVIYHNSKYYIDNCDSYQKRFMGFIGERVGNIIINNADYYLGIKSIKEIPIENI